MNYYDPPVDYPPYEPPPYTPYEQLPPYEQGILERLRVFFSSDIVKTVCQIKIALVVFCLIWYVSFRFA